MKKVVMWKGYNPNLFGGYFWSVEEVWNDWDRIYSDPYYVEIPDDFSIGETYYFDKMYFKDGCNTGYEVIIEDNRKENSCPCLVGGYPSEMIRLHVIGIVPEDER